MANEQEDIRSYNMYGEGTMGEVNIADEVVAIIAGLAATEVKGVAAMAGNITNELVAKLGMKNLSKGVRIEVDKDNVTVGLAINIEYGCNIPEVARAVQERVKNAIETMTGLNVLEINLRIADVNLENDK